jgi:hypothetical protein
MSTNTFEIYQSLWSIGSRKEVYLISDFCPLHAR